MTVTVEADGFAGEPADKRVEQHPVQDDEGTAVRLATYHAVAFSDAACFGGAA